MNNYFDLKKMFRDSFGYEAPSDYEFTDKATEPKTSSLGSPMYDKDSKGREYYLPVKIEDFYLPYPVVSIRGRKTIVDTPMVERDGSVKEFISMEDYSITIRGFIVDDNHFFPEDKIIKLRDLWERKEALKINNALTNIFLKGGQKVVIVDMDIPEVIGSKGVRPYTLELVSDLELEIEVKKQTYNPDAVRRDLSTTA